MYAWTRDECIRCLTRTDVPIFRLVTHASEHWTDPLLPKPPDLVERLRSLLVQCVDQGTLWQQRLRTPKEAVLEQVEPAFQACDPQGFAAAIRAVFSDAPDRAGDPFWSLVANVDDYCLLFDEPTLDRLQHAWASFSGRSPPGDVQQLECMLFNALLKRWNANEQLEQLLARSSDTFDLRDFTLAFKPVPSGLCDSASLPEDLTLLRRAGWLCRALQSSSRRGAFRGSSSTLTAL